MGRSSGRIAGIWRRIERVLADRVPATFATLAPPAGDADIAAVERAVGARLPADLAASLRVHNGQVDPRRLHVVAPYWLLMGTAEIVETWGMLTDIARDAGPMPAQLDEWWNEGWIPFAGSEGDALCVDRSTSGRGTPGEVVRFTHDNPVQRAVASDYAAWLDGVAARLEAGRFTVNDLACIDFEPEWPVNGEP